MPPRDFASWRNPCGGKKRPQDIRLAFGCLFSPQIPRVVTLKPVVSIFILMWLISTIVSLSWITYTNDDDFLSIFLNLFLTTCLITIAFLHCKIYSIVKRHRFEIHSQQVQGSGQTQDETRTTFERHKPSARGAFSIYLILLICYCQRYSLNLL